MMIINNKILKYIYSITYRMTMQYGRRRWIRRYAGRRPSSTVVVCNAFRSRLAYNNSNNIICRFGLW